MRYITAIARLSVFVVGAPAAAPAQKLPPVRRLDRPVAESKHEFKSVIGVRHLPGGMVLLNDAGRRQLLLLDSSLAVVSIVADSAPGRENSYGVAGSGLVAYAGDSSLFVLPRVPSMYLIDPLGRIARVMSVPRPQDAASMSSSSSGVPGFDAKGRWVYRGRTPPTPRPTLVPGGPPAWMIGADSAPIVRVDPATRVLDTAAMVRVSKLKAKLYPRENGTFFAMIEDDPLPMMDDWAVLADGSIAIVRGQDYHIDFINADGSKTRGPKMAFAWEALSDDAKVALMDSVRRAADEADKAPGAPTTIAGGPPAAGAGTSSGGGASRAPTQATADHPPPEFASPSDLPDYRPPFDFNASRADADGNLWIRTTHRESAPGFVYDVVSREGKVVDRVQLLPGRTVLGFGRGGIVYLLARDDTTSWIEKARWRVPQ